MKCNEYICDLCNKHIEDDDGMLVIKGKRRWYSWYEGGWEHKRIHICRDCQGNLQNLLSADSHNSGKVELNLYDKEEIHTNCTVQVLTNTMTGDVSVGWWKNGKEPKGFSENITY